MGARLSGGRLARRDEGAWPQRPVTEEQRRQTPAAKPPAGLPVFGPAAALLVGRRSTRDILQCPCGSTSRLAAGPNPWQRTRSSFINRLLSVWQSRSRSSSPPGTAIGLVAGLH